MSASPSHFGAAHSEGPPERSQSMFPDLTRDDVFRLETRRLWLRWPRLADAQTIVRLAGEKSVATMTARIPHPYTPGDAEHFVYAARRSNADGESLQLAVTPKGRPNALVGMVGISPGPDERPADPGLLARHPLLGPGLRHGGGPGAHRRLLRLRRRERSRSLGAGDQPGVAAGARKVRLRLCGIRPGRTSRPAAASTRRTTFRLDRRAWESLKTWSHTGLVREPASPETAPAALGLAI